MSSTVSPGMIINLSGKLYRVESSVKVTVAKGTPFIKTKLRNLMSGDVIERNFKSEQTVEEVFLSERTLEYLYIEEKSYLFLDIDNLEPVLVSPSIVAENVNYLKEGVQVKASFYGDTIFSLELAQFLELMVATTEEQSEKITVSNATKVGILETGAKIQVPLFIEVGDVIKVDTKTNEYIQRI